MFYHMPQKEVPRTPPATCLAIEAHSFNQLQDDWILQAACLDYLDCQDFSWMFYQVRIKKYHGFGNTDGP